MSRYVRPDALERSRWYGMIQRCTNPKHISFGRYGAKGVSVCQRWRDSFADFLSDVGKAPSRAHTLDRIDTACGYEPGNVRWATQTDQQRNRSNNTLLEVNGRLVTQAELVELTGLAQGTVARRLKLGWTVEEILSRPAKRGSHGRNITHCPHGHPYDDANTYWRGSHRQCRACARLRSRAKRIRALKEKKG